LLFKIAVPKLNLRNMAEPRQRQVLALWTLPKLPYGVTRILKTGHQS